MIKTSKICGISDLDTLNYIINHPYPPEFIGFICNYKKSSRYVGIDKLKELTKVDKKHCKFVAVLVKPDNQILEKIKNLNFDYYQLYDCDPIEVESIKNKYNKRIITAFTIQNTQDVKKHELYKNVADIYELSFDDLCGPTNIRVQAGFLLFNFKLCFAEFFL